ncbi:hypothetical protein METBIDRAFT_30630 [Metschnikowia bicuspidata var. bicuspidata NRRL YB-4993]|uniref:C3H1-type domain-containing protein n=1 Tax=Metschnikowia bicuspidata var. bicuspidata NRRL YB-4993 TaxID=869754 RepID=A0A1A0HKJ4_9ASCO|nr:hypothetical protein METBIDRAFT_30630 [Metschnikowia bicuspidata var. bicuspidata NRRL YB-4993]OBA24328.1 hypothetical protein METBIDRAFT_30630 [Metschnikowia bicuspidata var. bicuspidata NRRL YB-4993]
MPYDPEGPVAKQLTPLLVNELTATFNIPDDAQDTADYINMMIGQNRTASDICAEVKEVVNIPIDETFIGRVFEEIGRLELLQQQMFQAPPQQPQQPPQQPPAQPFQPPAPHQSQPQPAAEQPAVFPPPLASNPFQPVAPAPAPFALPTGPAASAFPAPQPAPQFPSGPQGQAKKDAHVNFSKQTTDARRSGGVAKAGGRAPGRGSGVSKDYVSGSSKTPKKSFGMQSAANLQRALALAPADSVNMQPFTPRPPKGRCADFPHCRNRECAQAHPTKKCFAYPNCPNAPGTCDYLHPAEDGALMQELEKTKQQFLDRKNQKFAPQVTLCKYGILCSKELCPFGHPTPANQDAKVIIQKWCRENKACLNPACEYAHSSPNYQAPAPAPAPAPRPVVPKFASQPAYNKYTKRTPTTLEQCKFGLSCTNQLCPKRHATSLVACRAGYNCTRMDCTFNHPIDEDCRFGDDCKNKPCYFRHPDGREKALFAGHPGQPTMQRPFAVAEDQVMEQATQI